MAELGVVGVGDEREDALERRARLLGAAGGGVREREHPERGVFEPAISETAGVRQGFGRERRDALESQVVELQAGQRHPQLEAGQRRGGRLLRERRAQAPQRFRERPSRPRLDRGLGADQLRALLPRVAREQLQRIGERGVCRLELARAEERVGPRLQQLDTTRRQVRVGGQQPQRAVEVARGARRGLLEHALGGIGE